LVVVASVRVGLRRAALLLEELLVADGGKGSGLVDDRGDINPLVNGDDLVNSGGGDGFSLDDGLD
jgi:hypothetical protein